MDYPHRGELRLVQLREGRRWVVLKARQLTNVIYYF
jgi:hypothetical protein